MHTETDATGHLSHAAGQARAAFRVLARTPAAGRDAGLRAMAAALRRDGRAVIEANRADLGQFDGSAAFRDRLALDDARVGAMARGLDDIAELPDPLARTLGEWTRPNGLRIRRIATPIGVIGMIYESRPNVGADAAGICLKSGNAVILRGGSESLRSARAIHAALTTGLRDAGLPEAAVQIAPTADRAHVAAMLGAGGLIDLIIPRGGKSLVERVQREARVPVLAHAEGLCHTYVHQAADPTMARRVLVNAKMRRPGVCGATETLLIDAAIAPGLLAAIIADLRALGCAFRADAAARDIAPDLPAAAEADFDTEWLDAILSIGWWTGSTPHWRTSPATAASTPTPSSPRMPTRPSNSCAASTARWRCGTPRRSSATAANSASAPRSGLPPAASTRAGRWDRSSSPPIVISFSGMARCVPDRRCRPAVGRPAADAHRFARRLVQSGSCRAPARGARGAASPAPRSGLADGLAGQRAEAARRNGAVRRRLEGARRLGDRRRIVGTGIEAALRTRYSIDTLRALRRRFPRAAFVWIMGADILEELPRWRRWRELAAAVPFAVLPAAPQPGRPVRPGGARHGRPPAPGAHGAGAGGCEAARLDIPRRPAPSCIRQRHPGEV